MLEIHPIQRYVITAAVVFNPGIDPIADAAEFCTWLRKFYADRGRLPKELKFLFREPEETAFNIQIGDSHADLACAFMKNVATDPEIAALLSQIKLLLEFIDMSNEVADRTAQRILAREFSFPILRACRGVTHRTLYSIR